jgi:2C-methyl-D-erythritol 2,4-cyclodiphosphate synthase
VRSAHAIGRCDRSRGAAACYTIGGVHFRENFAFAHAFAGLFADPRAHARIDAVLGARASGAES